GARMRMGMRSPGAAECGAGCATPSASASPSPSPSASASGLSHPTAAVQVALRVVDLQVRRREQLRPEHEEEVAVLRLDEVEVGVEVVQPARERQRVIAELALREVVARAPAQGPVACRLHAECAAYG